MNKLAISDTMDDIGYCLPPVLKLPWNFASTTVEFPPLPKEKSLSLRILSKVSWLTQNRVVLDILDLGLHDPDEEVRIEALTSMPLMVLCSGFGFLEYMFNRLE